jgi:predicted nucleic acid-binding protein
MNEERIEKSSGFGRLRQDIDRLIAAIAAHCRERVTTRTARPGSAPRDCAPDRTAGSG